MSAYHGSGSSRATSFSQYTPGTLQPRFSWSRSGRLPLHFRRKFADPNAKRESSTFGQITGTRSISIS